MSDFTREQAIEWCKSNGCNFIDPVFPPPSGWMWAESGDTDSLTLEPIFTMTDQGGAITLSEVATHE